MSGIITYPKQCQRCGYEWDAKRIKPKSCPNCHSYKWNLAREREDRKPVEEERIIVPFDEA